jgi:hypothetical protein
MTELAVLAKHLVRASRSFRSRPTYLGAYGGQRFSVIVYAALLGLAQPLLAVVGGTSSVDRFELAATSTLAWQGTTSSKIWASRGSLKLEKQ